MFSEVLFKMKYEHGDRAAFCTLSPTNWISNQVSIRNLNAFLNICVF